MARIGIFPHAELPHLIPALRLGRALGAAGHEVVVLGSDRPMIGRGHSTAWGPLLPRYGMADRARVHDAQEMPLAQWLVSVSRDLDLVAIDAVWQGLAFAWGDVANPPELRILHAGLPDFRRDDCPPWRFVTPAAMSEGLRVDMARDPWVVQARRPFADVANAACPHGRPLLRWDDGCTDLARLPGARVQMIAPCMELPGEAGRTGYVGPCLPSPSDVDWESPWSAHGGAERPLVICAFGTKGLESALDRAWALAMAEDLSRRFSACEVLLVLPGEAARHRGNLTVVPWVPLWSTMRARTGRTVLVAAAGVGAWREATAAGVPTVAIPRELDQFGVAARVAHFGTGIALVAGSWPAASQVAEAVAAVMEDAHFAIRVRTLGAQVDADGRNDPYAMMLAAPVSACALV